MNDSARSFIDISALLAPVPGALPAGLSIRYDPLYQSIRKAREEDDPSLPMGEWVRPLKKADWKSVSAHCVDILSSRSKDFQIAAWLAESWIHLYQMEGFNAAIDLLTGLVAQYWDTAHPQVEDGDDDARAAPFIWMNENLPLTLKLHITLLKMVDRMPSCVSLANWDQALITDHQKPETKKSSQSVGNEPLTRDELVAFADGANLRALITLSDQLMLAVSKWDALAASLDERMVVNPPSVARVGEMLRSLERAVHGLINGRDFRPPIQSLTPADVTTAEFKNNINQEDIMDVAPPQRLFAPATQEALPVTGSITSREDAYRLLDAVATYLLKTEPHSPTPYLVRRAVAWGQMSLADLMQEIVREEGDIARYFSLLGIKDSQR